MELIGSSISSIFLLAMCLSIFIENSTILIEFWASRPGDPMRYSKLVNTGELKNLLVVGIIGLGINVLSLVLSKFLILNGNSGHHAHLHHPTSNTNKERSNSEKSSEGIPKGHKPHEHLNNVAMILHVIGDLFGSILVIVSVLAVNSGCKEENCSLKLIDPIFSILFSMILAVSSARMSNFKLSYN